MSTYRSTRSAQSAELSFEEAVITGLANDGGLFVPSSVPKLPQSFLQDWANSSFQDLAFNIMRLYISSAEISDAELHTLVNNSYSTFRHPQVTPVVDLHSNVSILELFHGPTYAFKDVALQFVGNLFEFFLQRHNAKGEHKHIAVVGATSGDTGSAAIYGLRGKKDVSVFILYPNGRISPVQEQQMTTVPDANVHCVAVDGSFDNCQDIVKAVFADVDFNKQHNVGAVNSINWARILAQITYYFFAYFQVVNKNPGAKVRFTVPSGNFGDILAGFYAQQMGLPIDKLIIATNENDILDRFLKSGEYSRSNDVAATLSPAMDILISSNFERLLWFLARQTVESDEKAGEVVDGWFKQLKSTGTFSVGDKVLALAQKDFDSGRVTNDETLATITATYESTKYVLDPHTAVGIRVTENHKQANAAENVQYVSLSTAHPAKFDEAVTTSLKSFETYDFERDVLPQELKALRDLPKRVVHSKADLEEIKKVIVAGLAQEQQ